MSKFVESNRILANGVCVSNNSFFTQLNNNDFVVGPAGAGKTRGYVIPNTIHAKHSIIVADTKGTLYKTYGKCLEQKGYDVMLLDFKDIANSPNGYNPMNYIRECTDIVANRNGDRYSVQDVKKVAQALCPNQDIRTDPFWENAARQYSEAGILFVLNALPREDHHLGAVRDWLARMGSEALENMIDEECELHPRSEFSRMIGLIRQNKTADRMHASIRGILAQHLDAVAHLDAERMFLNERQVDLDSFLRGKTALFVNVSDTDRSQDGLVNLFYTQAIQFLISAADRQPDGRLPIPVRFILDDFATNTVIPDFDNLISVIRSREIYVSLIVQSLSQLEGLYGHAKAQTIINNSDHCLYLGGTDIATARYFAEKFNCQVSTVLNLPLDTMFLFTRGSEPRKVRKYDLEQDDTYRALMRPSKQPPAVDAADIERF